MRRVGTRLLLPLLATVFVIMSAYAAWALRQRERTLSAQARRETHAYSTALGLAVQYAYQEGRESEVQQLVDGLSADTAIHGVVVYDREGNPVHASEQMRTLPHVPRELLEHVRRTGAATEFTRRIGRVRVLSVLRPVYGEQGNVEALLEVAQPLTFVEAEKTRTRIRFVANTLTLLVALSFLILLLVHRLVALPLRRFAAGAEALGGGRLEHRIPQQRAGRELNTLAAAMNSMAESLQRAHQDLLRHTEERVALERKLRETEKMAALGKLAAGLAHEIGTPLNVIAGRAEMLLKQDPPAERRAASLRIIIAQIARITAIVRNLLDFARRREPRFERIDLRTVIRDVASFLELELERARVRVDLQLSEPLPVNADAHLFHQVFLNLLLNASQALDAAGVEGTIQVRGQAWNSTVVVEVEDDGPGIPTDQLERIFEPFYTTKTGGEGTGLGLAVARTIVAEHGGTIDAANRGAGALFTIILPSAPEDA